MFDCFSYFFYINTFSNSVCPKSTRAHQGDTPPPQIFTICRYTVAMSVQRFTEKTEGLGQQKQYGATPATQKIDLCSK